MRRSRLWLVPLAMLGLAAGCEGDPQNPGAAAAKKVKPREIIRKWTQDVRKLEPELAEGGQVSDNKVTAKDYITLQGDVYVTTIGKLSIDQIDYALRLYEAEHGEMPKTYEEFMREIIKKGQADGIRLPMLPFYQEYGYDEKNRKLVVIEYPAKKEEVQKQRDEELGRR